MRQFRGLIMGCPGSGKGTQTKRILEEYSSIKAISSGDVLRHHIHTKTDFGIKIESLISGGDLVPSSLITPMLLARLDTINSDWLLDGFPRTISQAKELDRYLSLKNTPINFVINLDVPWSTILRRIEDRWIHGPSGRTYNLSYNPPISKGLDDITGEHLVKRPDDDVNVFERRLKAYEGETIPLIEYYSDRGYLFNFKGESSDEISPRLLRHINNFYRQ